MDKSKAQLKFTAPYREITARGSFRKQIILTFVVGVFVLISAFASYLVLTEWDNLRRDSLEETTSMAQALASGALPWVLSDDVAGLQESVHAFHGFSQLSYAMVISPAGRVLAHSDPSKVGMYLKDEQSLSLLKTPHAMRVMEDSHEAVAVAVPIKVGERLVGWAKVRLLNQGNSLYLREMIRNSIVFLLVSTVLSFLAAMIIANRLGQRIGSLVRVAEEVQSGNFSMRVSTPAGEDEVARLGNSMNKMLETLSQNERELRTASLYTRSLIEASLDPLVTISPDGKITDVNEATEKATGLSRTELIGTDFSNYFTEPDKARQGYQEVFLKGSVTNYPLALRHRDGHITDVLYNASVYRSGAGKVLGVFAAARDITERKRAEEQLRAASLYTRSLIEASPDPLVTISREGKITDVNKATENVTGRGRAELIGTDFSDYFTEPDKARAGYQQVFQQGFVTDYPLDIRHRDGHVTDVLYNASVYRDEAGAVSGVFAAARDITELKEAEDKISELNRDLEQRVTERTAQLEAANKELEAFSYSVSHDLRSPLRAIDGFSNILLEDYAATLDVEGKRLVGIVRDNTLRMARLIDDILAFSRLGRKEMTQNEVDMTQLANETSADLASSREGRNVKLEIGELPPAHGDAAMLRQVWVNLLSNAIKFTRTRPEARIDVSGRVEGSELVYCVRDNGVGFDMQFADKLFGVFQRLHSMEEFEGTGAGLAIVKRIVTRHGGRVWADGKVNEGAAFYFALPAKEVTEETA